MYKKINFKDRIDSKPDTYLVDGKPTIIAKDNTNVTQEGTLLNAENLNHIEDGIIENAKRIEEVFTFGTKRKEELVAILVSKGIQATVKDSWEVLYSKLKNLNTQYPKLKIESESSNYKKDLSSITTSAENGTVYLYCGGGYSGQFLDKLTIDGKSVWSMATDGGEAKVVTDNNYIYFADNNSICCATTNGDIKWKIKEMFINTTIQLGENYLVCGGLKEVIKINKNGTKEWVYQTQEKDLVINAFVCKDNIIVVTYKNIVKLNLNGNKVDTFKLPELKNDFFNAFFNKNILYVYNRDKLFLFDVNGSLLRTISINNIEHFFLTHEGVCWNTLDNNIYTHKIQENIIVLNNLELPAKACVTSNIISKTETKVYVVSNNSILVLDYK